MTNNLCKDLQKVYITTNPNYKKSGTKSYVYLLNKWGFEPTKPGPYYQLSVPAEDGHQQPHFHKFGSETFGPRVLAKKTSPNNTHDEAAAAQAGNVPAEDIQNDSLYLSPVKVGSPAQTLLLDFDTGSADLWVWSTKLPNNVQSTPGHTVFDPSKSSSYSQSSGSSWKISYGDNSSASGIVGTDTIDLGGLIVNNQAIELAGTLSRQFIQGPGDGLLGLAFGNINTVRPTAVRTPVENMISQNDIPQSSQLFTAKLGSWRDVDGPDKGEGFYTFGFIDQPTVTASGQHIAWAPVNNHYGFWQFASGFTVVNGRVISEARGTAIADTGTTLALVSDQVCQAIYSVIPGASYDEANQGYVYPNSVTPDQLPVVSVAVGNTQITIQKEDLGFADTGNGTIYGGIQSRGKLPFDILGDTFLKCVYAVFDQGNARFGVVQRPEQNQNISVPQ